MLYEHFTDRFRKVMGLANKEAQRMGHEYIGTEHILLGLVAEGAGVAAEVLKNLDIDLAKIRLEIEKIVLPEPDVVTGKLPQTPRAKKVIEYSVEEARNLNHNYVGTEHLLLGLIREQDGVASQVLMNQGLKFEDVREEVLNLLGVSVDIRDDASREVDVPVRQDFNPGFKFLSEEVVQALKEINDRIGVVVAEKEWAVAEQDFPKASELRDKEHKIKQQVLDAVRKLQTLIRESGDQSI